MLLAITSAAGSEGTFPTNWGFPGCARERTRRFAGAGVGKGLSWLAWRSSPSEADDARRETCWRELALFYGGMVSISYRALFPACFLVLLFLFQNNVGVF